MKQMSLRAIAPIAVIVTAFSLSGLAATPPANNSFDGGETTCVENPAGIHVNGAASPGSERFALVAADNGRAAISVQNQRRGPVETTPCTFDVTITGFNLIGVPLLPNDGGLSAITNGACTLAAKGDCTTTASASWFIDVFQWGGLVHDEEIEVGETGVHADGCARADIENATDLSAGTLGIEILYELGITVNAVHTPVLSSSVTILDPPEC